MNRVTYVDYLQQDEDELNRIIQEFGLSQLDDPMIPIAPGYNFIN